MKLLCTLLFAGLLFISGCDATSASAEEKNCTETKTAWVSQVSGASTVALDDELKLVVSFPVNNGCGQFNQFIESVNGNEISIEVEAIYDTCSMCTMDIPTRKADYIFRPKKEGSYILKFKTSATEVITKEITVN
ncbi:MULTISPECIES: hypothetical protein [Leeuwenhoekiella]|nr:MULTISPECIES: hypothetical protein [Leeuwenhoekiella]|tara:strand:+ start:97 stop:501 length:405 start_codon:yes stop_codon:yes gene_type:complete